MTAREQYYFARHNERLAQWKSPKDYRTSATVMVEALKELYSFSLYGRDKAKYFLICKYDGNVSTRLMSEKKLLRAKGEKAAREEIRDLVFSENPILKLIPKSTDFVGKAIALPISFGAMNA